MKTIITDPAAQAELEDAAEWYEKQREGLGGKFLESVTEAIAAIQRRPRIFPFFRGTGIRKYGMRRFPYVVLYEERHANIWIYAFAHTKRKPGYWMNRVGDEEIPGEPPE